MYCTLRNKSDGAFSASFRIMSDELCLFLYLNTHKCNIDKVREIKQMTRNVQVFVLQPMTSCVIMVSACVSR